MSGCVWWLSTAVQQRKSNNVDLKIWILWKCHLFFKDWCRSARTFCSADEGLVCLVALLKSEETDSIPRVGEIQFYWVTNVFNVRLNQDVQELRLQIPNYGVLSWKTASQWTLHWCSVFQTNAAQMGFFFSLSCVLWLMIIFFQNCSEGENVFDENAVSCGSDLSDGTVSTEGWSSSSRWRRESVWYSENVERPMFMSAYLTAPHLLLPQWRRERRQPDG